MSEAEYTFKQQCDSCSTTPVLKDLGMCSVCTFGEADSMWEWLDDPVTTKEHKSTQQKLDELLTEMHEGGMINDKGDVDPMAAMLMHLDQHVMDRIEALS